MQNNFVRGGRLRTAMREKSKNRSQFSKCIADQVVLHPILHPVKQSVDQSILQLAKYSAKQPTKQIVDQAAKQKIKCIELKKGEKCVLIITVHTNYI